MPWINSVASGSAFRKMKIKTGPPLIWAEKKKSAEIFYNYVFKASTISIPENHFFLDFAFIDRAVNAE